MSRPRLLLVLTELPPGFGGMQTHAVHLCRHLQRQGYPFLVATYREAPAEPLAFPVARCLSRISWRDNLRRLAHLIRDFRADLVYSSTVFYGALRETTGVPVICRSAGNDVLRPWIAWPFRFLSRLLRTPIVEDRLYARFRRLAWPERLERILLAQRQAAMRHAALHHARVLANSAYTAGLLEAIGLAPAQIRVLAGGVDARRFFPAVVDRPRLRRALDLPEQRYLLMTACRLVPKKGVELLLAAVDRLPRVHLIVVGDGPSRPRYEALAASMGLVDRVTFTGRIPQDRKSVV